MRSVPEAELWVVGERLDSDRGEDMVALLRAAGLGFRLRMLGYREDIPALLAAADIFTLPSRFEGLPMSVIEAMLTGLPIVASDVSGPDEQVEQGITGLKVPAGDAAALGAALGGWRGTPWRVNGWARQGGSGRWTAMTKRKSWRGPWTCWGCRFIPPRLTYSRDQIDMTDIVSIRRALISVSDKAGLVPFAALWQTGVKSCPPAVRPRRCAMPACR